MSDDEEIKLDTTINADIEEEVINLSFAADDPKDFPLGKTPGTIVDFNLVTVRDIKHAVIKIRLDHKAPDGESYQVDHWLPIQETEGVSKASPERAKIPGGLEVLKKLLAAANHGDGRITEQSMIACLVGLQVVSTVVHRTDHGIITPKSRALSLP